MSEADLVDDLMLRTERLVLLPCRPEHATALFPCMREPALSRFLAWAPHVNEDETRTVLAALAQTRGAGTGYHWTIFEHDAARGIVSLIDVRRRHRLWEVQRAEIAYWIAVGHQGRGLATEATRAAVDAAFGPLGLNRLIISNTSENPASGAIPGKLGFRFVGCERQAFRKGGRWHDMNHHELLREDWLARGKGAMREQD